ncbi:nitrile hydratase subunit alpha [Ruegeria lacuscaerulensis]|uniref:nitrile hydratase subunit alpha n=1 Tax=Ruegeria lacuscaerulensis TaxID=55218 RepID=UPI00147D4ACD|nr:nitrile hydratase subunit alpha [Ruegeria lacuscaerulensis]
MPHDHDPLEEGPALRVRALEELMVAKGLVKPETLDSIVEYYERETGPRNGAAVVARAWTDPEYKDWLLRDGSAAINAMGFSGFQGEHIRVVENTDAVHNVIVCTLCSCYPWPVLGLPPTWYKSPAYRSRVVREPRAVLAEFGVSLPDEVQIKVWDSTAEIRYLVLPRRPDGTERLSTAELADLVTRNGMIGTALV